MASPDAVGRPLRLPRHDESLSNIHYLRAEALRERPPSPLPLAQADERSETPPTEQTDLPAV
jgi:hypothetical protein